MARANFFSVIIPTKNRSHIVGFAIESVLHQTFDDYEIIVSDNDDSSIKTRDAVKVYSDSRIKYFRTSGDLSMPDNWEFALTKASGQFVTILQDKQVLYPNSLELLHEAISSGHGPIIIWNSDKFDDTVSPPVLIRHNGSGKINSMSSDLVVSRLVNKGVRFKELPRLINSCISNDFVKFIQNETVLKRFFDVCCPDFVAAFVQLNFIDNISYIDRSLNITGGMSLGTGTSHRKKGETAERFVREIGENVCYDFVPLKLVMAFNAIMNDYYKIRSKVDGRLQRFEFSPTVYLLECYRDILAGEREGSDMSYEKRLWTQFMEKQAAEVKRRVGWIIKKMIVSRKVSEILHSMPGYSRLMLSLKGRTQPTKIRGYTNAFEAAGFTCEKSIPQR
jgi:glycosyltransferase involved in cell wall biosynthesis